jgi:hypothetical protein
MAKLVSAAVSKLLLALSPLPLARLVAEGRLTQIPGIGEALTSTKSWA